MLKRCFSISFTLVLLTEMAQPQHLPVPNQAAIRPSSQDLTQAWGLLDRDPAKALALAEEHLDRTIQPDDHTLWQAIGALASASLEAQGADVQLEHSIQELQALLSLEPGDREHHTRIRALLGRCCNALAEHEYASGQTEHARALFDRANQILDGPDLEHHRWLVLSSRSIFHIKVGELEQALKWSIAAFKLAEKLAIPSWQRSAASNLGYVYRLLKDYPNALEWFQRAAQLAESTGDHDAQAMALNEIGNVHLLSENTDLALQFKAQALELLSTGSNVVARASCLADMGIALSSRGRLDDAAGYLQQAAEQFQTVNMEREVALCLYNLSMIQVDLDSLQDAETSARKALEISKRLNLSHTVLDTRKTLALIHQARGSCSAAYEQLSLAIEEQEQLIEEENQERLAEMRAQFETETKQQRIEILERDQQIQAISLSRQTLIRNGLIVGLGLLVLILALLAQRYQEKTRAHALIQSKNQELSNAYRQLELTSREDPLTGIANRRELCRRFEEDRHRADRRRESLSLILCDVDHFKTINDTRGHDCGDRVLKELARMLRSGVRRQDTVGRWGGEEFLIILPDTDIHGAILLAEKIRTKIAARGFQCENAPFRVTMTLGASQVRARETMDDAVKRADKALYQGKEAGRNRVVMEEASDDMVPLSGGTVP